MLKLSTGDIAGILGAKISGNPLAEVREIVTDTRQAGLADGILFIALRGKNHDGHSFIESLIRNGIRSFLVEKIPAEIHLNDDLSFIEVENTLAALQKLAAHIRSLFSNPVIAVTGSAGKTIVKEWLAEVIGNTLPVIRSPKSYNSQVGVPLSLLRLDPKYQMGIFEAGISLPGEMISLQNMIRPDIGVITNIGDAHSENFESLESKAAEKLKLFKDASLIIFCRDQLIIDRLIKEDPVLKSKKLVAWSATDQTSPVKVKYIQKDQKTLIDIQYNNKGYSFTLPFLDRASVENATTVAVVCLSLNIPEGAIKEGLSGLVSVAMRMDLKSGINDCQLIEDYYNSDPGSLSMAIDFLKTRGSVDKTLILSDFIQNGRDERDLYSDISKIISNSDVSKFIGIGRSLHRNSDLFPAGSQFYKTTEEFISAFNSLGFMKETILIKGARRFEFERIGRLLEKQTHQTVLEVNLDAISHNINEFRRQLKPDTKIMAMVKAFAYGAGPAEISALMEYHRINYLTVAYVDEGIELRNSGVSLPIMVMNPEPSSWDMLIKYSLEPEIFSQSSLQQFTAAATRNALIGYPVHIKIDSGMHRLGFLPDEVPGLAENLKKADVIKVASVFSHLAGSDEPSLDDFTHKQARVFIESARLIREALGYPFMMHLLNSAGIARFPEYQFDMVRTGIGMYGAGEIPGLALRNSGTFKTRISQIKTVPAGEPVGYGCTDVSDKERMIAILPVGYADGLNRLLGNRRGNLYIRSRYIDIIGNICMDMCMADVTGLDASEGDEAEIFGEHIHIDDVARKCSTIPYEILTSIPRRVKRVFYRE